MAYTRATTLISTLFASVFAHAQPSEFNLDEEYRFKTLLEIRMN